MIRRLHIRNYAIIEEVEIVFSDALTIITGETGAGKSILLGALGLILGQRAEGNKVLYNPNEKCVIEAHFEVKNYDLRHLFEQHQLDFDADEVIIRRELSPNGKTRAFINDTPTTLPALKDITGALLDLHQQFDTLDLQHAPLQLQMVDALAGHKTELTEYRTLYKTFDTDRRQLAEWRMLQQQSSRELDFLKFQLQELENANLLPSEQMDLEQERNQLQHAEDIKSKVAGAFMALTEGETPLLEQLRDVSIQISGVSKYHPDLPALAQKIDSLYYELEEVANACENIAEATEYNPERIVAVQERLDQLYKLMKKHGALDVTALVAFETETRNKVEQLGDLSGDIAHLERKIEGLEKQLRQLAVELHQRRVAVAQPFADKVHALLAELKMEHAQLFVKVEPALNLGPDGADFVQFLFASNKGSRAMAIKDVASGGELSRLSLVTKSLVAASIPLPTLIFDEIDAGVSGDVAQKMGLILKKLSGHHQVVVITHSPQVAAKALKHYFVYKTLRDDRTFTHVRELNEEERVRSIAVMLSQNPPSESALANARELIRSNDN